MKSNEKSVAMTSSDRKEIKRKRIMRLFICSAEEIIRREGLDKLTIRKVADATGYSSATIYSYFEDLDELTLYASLRYRKEYLIEMSQQITDGMSALEQFRTYYLIHCEYIFHLPNIYMNLFFGRHSQRIAQIKKIFYDLFPEDYVQQTDLIREMFNQEQWIDADRYLARHLANANYIKKENADIVAELAVRVQETFLYEFCIHPNKSISKQIDAFMKLLDHIIATN